MDIYLHHYPASLFSEKVRLLLGYLGLDWHSVIIPTIMPRPRLMPLSGGYRKTPVLQIGANVYCDTKVIARGLARHADATQRLYRHGFVAHRLADWADTQLFQVTVALNFSPEAVAAMMSQLSEADVAAFQKDRAELTKGAAITRYSAPAARAFLDHYLDELERSLTARYLLGDDPSIADFAVYHCLWFLGNNSVNARLLEPYGEVGRWLADMAAFGHGGVSESSADAALAAGRAAEPQCPPLDNRLPDGFALGDPVSVTPVDYGRNPVSGTLTAWTPDEIVITRDDPDAGRIMNHFPNAGFEVSKA